MSTSPPAGPSRRLADALARILGLPPSRASRPAVTSASTNVAGSGMPTYGESDAPPVTLTHVRHPDGRWRPSRPPMPGEPGATGNPLHPGSRGRNCAKGPATHNQTYDPERILYPLKRVGARGEGRWKRITWNEALDEIGAAMRASRQKRRDGIMYHVGRPGEDHYTNRCITAWGVDGHNSHTNVCSAAARFGAASARSTREGRKPASVLPAPVGATSSAERPACAAASSSS